jgi:hypothetical protein
MKDDETTKRIIPNKGRRLQVAPTGRRLFGETAKDTFLEHFAETCNCSLAARRTGFHYRTVLRHWREDSAFGARCEEALRIGYVRLEELALREAARALDPAKRRRRKAPSTSLRTGPSPQTGIEGMDAAMALQLLREHRRAISGGPPKPGRAPSVASNAEMFDALVKRLKAFGVRVSDQSGTLIRGEGESL